MKRRYRYLLICLLPWFCLLSAQAQFDVGKQLSYQGSLVPNNWEAFIEIQLDLPESYGRVNSQATLGPPLSLAEQKLTGDKTVDRCNLKLDLGSRGYIHLAGICNYQEFYGSYTWFINEKPKKRGSFRLNVKKRDEAKSEPGQGQGREPLRDPHLTMVACIKQSSACLLGCPKDDEEAAFLCVNHCRHREQQCKKRLKEMQRLAAPG